MSKINCPFHEDSTASMELYPDGYAHCFGCGAHAPISELDGVDPSQLRSSKYVEDLQERLAYIKTLRALPYRGLQLPADSAGVYLVWPGDTYFKQRLFNEDRGKYRNPAGHKRPLFWANQVTGAPLVIVEGEFNALSIAQACPDLAVCSPGAATDFYSSNGDRYLPDYLNYSRILIIADKDTAGTAAAIMLKANLQALGHEDTGIYLAPEDANEVLQKYGKERLQTEIYENLGMPERVRSVQGDL